MAWSLNRIRRRATGSEIFPKSIWQWSKWGKRAPHGEDGDGPVPLIVHAAARSIRGSYRDSNEDCVYCSPDAMLFVVADGMGGHAGGRDASRIVVETFARKLGDPARLKDLTDHELQMLVEHTTLQARREMVKWAGKRPCCSHMGSTMVLGLILGHRLFYANIGDSRLYLFRRGSLRLLSRDETLAQALRDAGAISRHEMATSHLRNRLINFVGVRELDHLPELRACQLKDGDRLLLATDGLTGVVDHGELTEILKGGEETRSTVDELIRLAVNHDSKDNISAVLVDVGPSAAIAIPIDEAAEVDCGRDLPNCLAVA